MLRFPDVSATQITFIYANKLWIAPREGGAATPVASPPGPVRVPKFHSDGKTIAFLANYDGNFDLYTIPSDGGTPSRITHHPATETLCDWAPGDKLLFQSNGLAGLGRQQQLFTVGRTGGLPARLPVPYGEDAALSADGRYLAYTPFSTRNATWKRYRGGWASDIWIFDLQENKSKRITDWEGTDAFPMWNGGKLYYLSDNGPEQRLNIWVYDTKSGKRQQITRFTEYDVKWPSIGPGPDGKGEIVLQLGSELRLLDLKTNQSRLVEIKIPGDRPTLRAKAVDTARFINSWSLSPNAKRVAVEARGEIWTLPAKEGAPRNLTRTSGAAERSPSWSPDGRWIAYFSDATGEYELYVTQSDGKGETKQLTQNGNAYRYDPIWSPNSKHILFSDKTGAIYLHTLANNATRLVDTDPMAQKVAISWSPDSRWIAYERNADPRGMTTLWVYNVENGQKRPLTSGMFQDRAPVFDRKGEYLYYASSRVFTPTYADLGTTWIYQNTEALIALPLRANVASPYNPTSDEETWGDKDKTPASGEPKKTVLDISLIREEAKAAQGADEVTGEWSGDVTGEGLPINPLAVKAILKLGANNTVTGKLETSLGSGDLTGSFNAATKEISLSTSISGVEVKITAKIAGANMTGTILAMGRNFDLKAKKSGGAAPAPQGQGGGTAGAAGDAALSITIDFDGIEARAIQLAPRPGRFGQLAVNAQNHLLFLRAGEGIKLFDIKDPRKEEKMVAAGSGGFDITPDGKKLLVLRGSSASIQDAVAGVAGENVPTSGMTAQIEPREEWKQIFHEAWRLQRDFFYDPTMHGVDWKAVREQYAKMLADCNSREDVGFVISEMISELNVGHAYYFGGDIESAPGVSVGMLGADFALKEGAYQIAKIHRGAAWDTDAVGPLSQPGVKIKEGDYLLAVNGTALDTGKDPWAAFQGMADRVVTLTVSEKPKIDASAREVVVRLLGAEGNLRYRSWIERNRAYVEKATNGRVGYIYVPNTGTDGQSDLMRQFVGQMTKEALIIDERWNGGGQIPTRFIELLNRPVTNYWARRDGKDWVWPPDSHQGPKCMLINGPAGSGGDMFPWLFRQSGLGKLIGMRTWGGLVGITGYPPLVDGATVTAPAFAFYKKDGNWGIEGHGVDPDIEVVDDPALMTNGGDPQLDAAIKQMLNELKARPYVAPKRPAYPNRTKIGIPDKDR
jgi:tricorn protease